jgi:large subunit ribosomal protein L6
MLAAKSFAWLPEENDAMSRIAKYPVDVPKGVDVTLSASEISIKGPLGTLKQFVLPSVKIEREDDKLLCKAVGSAPNAGAMSGTMRALVNNMVSGVTKGFEKKLTLVGVGYRAQAQGDKLNLTLGFSHPVVHKMPQGVKVETPTQTEIVIKGINRQQVGQVAAEVRAYRSPEPYKGKGVRYSDETVVIKETKKK